MMDVNINVKKICQEKLLFNPGLAKYRNIMQQVDVLDVSTDARFQKTFNGFYRIRRNELWRRAYYEYFEKVKCGAPTYAEIITHLYEQTGNVEASFSSKMLATICPEKPIWDHFVLQNLGLRWVTYAPKSQQLQDAILLYTSIEEWYDEFLHTDKAREYIDVFDEVLPDYTWLSDTKKIDFILWSNR